MDGVRLEVVSLMGNVPAMSVDASDTMSKELG